VRVTARADTGRAEIRGVCTARFGYVLDAFQRAFAELGELGGAVCVTHQGDVVVDLVGGLADEAQGVPWNARTLVMVWSTTKGVLATCLHLLGARGEVDLDAPVARYWPEFGDEGKRDVSVAMVLNHQAGLPGLAKAFPADVVFDWDEVTARLAGERPLWEPGARHGYHSFTFGWILGEVIRRVTTLSPGRFIAEALARPLGLDLWVGLPATEDARVAVVRSLPLVPHGETPFGRALAAGEPVQVAVVNSWGRFTDPDICEQRAARAAEVPAANGFATAQALAVLYQALATDGRIGDVTLPPRVRARMARVESAGSRDATTLGPSRFSSGFQKGAIAPATGGLAMPEEAFGHAGQGGSFALADPRRRLSVAYVTNVHAAPEDHSRAQGIIDAAYRSIGGME
jgi:CubicO group peptidase (beta-lactamase class C family)